MPGVKWGAPALGCNFEESLKRRDELLSIIEKWSPDALLHKGAAPIYFENNWGLTQPENVTEMDYKVHSPAWALGFQVLAQQAGVVCHVKYPDHPTDGYKDIWDFIVQELMGGVGTQVDAFRATPDEEVALSRIWREKLAISRANNFESEALDGKMGDEWINLGDKSVIYVLNHIDEIAPKSRQRNRTARVMLAPLVKKASDRPFLAALKTQKDSLHLGMILGLLGDRSTTVAIIDSLVNLLSDRRQGREWTREAEGPSDRICDMALWQLLSRLDLDNSELFHQGTRDTVIDKFREWWKENETLVRERLSKSAENK